MYKLSLLFFQFNFRTNKQIAFQAIQTFRKLQLSFNVDSLFICFWHNQKILRIIFDKYRPTRYSIVKSYWVNSVNRHYFKNHLFFLKTPIYSHINSSSTLRICQNVNKITYFTLHLNWLYTSITKYNRTHTFPHQTPFFDNKTTF